jgi:4-hydroxybenzoate polyprenyltransferase
MSSLLVRSKQLGSDCYMFVRLPAFGFTGILPFLGAISARAPLTRQQILGLLAVAILYHNYAYVLNDIIDLPLDRTEPLRARYPLVKGAIRPKYALIFVCLQLPALFAITHWLGADQKAYIALCASLVLMTIYNAGSKYTPFPLVMDTVQGVAWGTFALLGAFIMAGQATGLTWVLFFIILVYVLMINGVHGSLRDLENDLKSGAKTTAIALGARPREKQAVLLSKSLVLYTLFLQLLLCGLSIFPVYQNWFDYETREWRIVLAVIAAIAICCLLLSLLVIHLHKKRWEMLLVGVFHLIVSMGFLIAPFAFYASRATLALVLTIYVAPVPVMWLHDGFKWGR